MGNKLIEVNVCSPGGFAEINDERSDNLQEYVIDFAEQVNNARKKLMVQAEVLSIGHIIKKIKEW